MKKYTLLLFMGLTITLNAQKIDLDVPLIKQQETNWCWAAASKCVLAYYGHWDPQQCDIAEYVRLNGIFNNFGLTDCCVDPSNLQGCNHINGTSTTGGTGSISDILVYFGNIINNVFGHQTDTWAIESHLAKQRPLIIRRENINDPTHGHAIVIYEVDGDKVSFMDPGYGFNSLPYNWLFEDENFRWDKTIIPYVSPVPAHCFNCIRDGDEEEIDCGGSCPPCESAPAERSYVTPTNNLPSQVKASKKITAGNAAVKVLSRQNVNFITSETGSIVLLPGFEAQAGSNFSAQIKNNSGNEFTRVCGKYCGDGHIHGTLYKYQDHFCLYDFVNVDKVEFEVYTVVTGQLLHKGVVNVTNDGTIDLWDLNGSGNSSVYCVAYILVHPCNWYSQSYEYTFWIVNRGKSLEEEPDETENSDTFLSPPINNILLQDENTTPSFFIIPNPNSGAFQIETNFPLSDIVNLKITNLSGALIYETQNLSSNTIQLPASASGQHVVIVTLKAGAVLTQKMMLQR